MVQLLCAWIADPKVYQYPKDGVRAGGDSGGYTRQFCYYCGVFVDNTCQALLADQMGSSNMLAGFGMLFTKKTRKILETLYT